MRIPPCILTLLVPLLAIQVHNRGEALAQVRDVLIAEPPAASHFIGATPPPAAPAVSPLTPRQELATFSLPPGFEIQLVAAEDPAAGAGKFVAIDWDARGALWTMTAFEYPVDANENPELARQLYASRARDRVLVYDRDLGSATGYAAQPRTFADGLAIPLGILPYRNGVYVQHGEHIAFLEDSDGDGRADRRTNVLSGFGVQDSHLFPHQFTRAPGGWIWFAQGAFNYGKVRTTRGAEIQFDQTRMARFRPDGSDFDITSQGPCNIWGLFLTTEGETWIQEANDFGYPAMPFHEYANYPGCSQAQWKSYAPEFPATARDFQMGGTGLSGLAFSDPQAWPVPYGNVLFIANPITRAIQALQLRHEGGRPVLSKLPDFVLSSDPWFRPVALRLGPDGCLYVVDWYNQIISHNEVSRTHPERDKIRGRIWRIRHTSQSRSAVADLTSLPPRELLRELDTANATRLHLAWQTIVDRPLRELRPQLAERLSRTPASQTASPAQEAGRFGAMWALEGLGLLDLDLIQPLLSDPNRNMRREAVRALGNLAAPRPPAISLLEPAAGDPDPQVRAEVLRVLGRAVAAAAPAQAVAASPEILDAIAHSLRLLRAPLDAPTAKSTHSGRIVKIGEAYERDFERYLARLFLEQNPAAAGVFLADRRAEGLSVEARLLAALCLEPRSSATAVARLLPQLERPVGAEEILRLAKYPDQPGVSDALRQLLARPGTVETLLQLRTQFEAGTLATVLAETGRSLLGSLTPAQIELGARLAGSFQIAALEQPLAELLAKHATTNASRSTADPGPLSPHALAALRALTELHSEQVELYATIAARADATAQESAVRALAATRSPAGPARLVQLYPQLDAQRRRLAFNLLSATRTGAAIAIKALRSGTLPKDDLDAGSLERISTLLGNDPDLAALVQELGTLLTPVLRLDGKAESYVASQIALSGPFTIECWLKLDPGINNQDSILAGKDQLDFNFHDSRFRVWIGGGVHDVVVATRNTPADVWMHYAVTRDTEGTFRIYLNGELNAVSAVRVPRDFAGLDIGRSSAGGATAGWMTEFRAWTIARTDEVIRADFDRSFRSVGPATRPKELRVVLTETHWPGTRGDARVLRTMDAPALLGPEEAAVLAAKFTRFHELASAVGSAERGRTLFATLCASCHSVGGQGGQIGPILNGAGAMGTDALLRNLLTPNAAMEPGYRVFRIQLKDGEILDGLRVAEDEQAIVLRRPNVPDSRIPQSAVTRAAFTRSSMMPEGLLEALPAADVTDLFAYLRTLK